MNKNYDQYFGHVVLGCTRNMTSIFATLEGGRCTRNMTSILATMCLAAQEIWPVFWPRWREVDAQKTSLPKAAVTVLCTPDDGCGWHQKHVEWTCRIINRLLCVASLWTIINIYYKYHLQSPETQEIQDLLTLEDGTDVLSRNVSKKLPLHAPKCAIRA